MYSVGGTTCLASLMMLFCQLWGHQQGAALLWCFAPLTLVHLWVVTQRWGCLLSAPLQLALGSLFLPLFTEEGHLLAPNAPLLCLFSNNDLYNRSLSVSRADAWLWNFCSPFLLEIWMPSTSNVCTLVALPFEGSLHSFLPNDGQFQFDHNNSFWWGRTNILCLFVKRLGSSSEGTLVPWVSPWFHYMTTWVKRSPSLWGVFPISLSYEVQASCTGQPMWLPCVLRSPRVTTFLCCWLWNFELISIGFGPHLHRCQNWNPFLCFKDTNKTVFCVTKDCPLWNYIEGIVGLRRPRPTILTSLTSRHAHPFSYRFLKKVLLPRSDAFRVFFVAVYCE